MDTTPTVLSPSMTRPNTTFSPSRTGTGPEPRNMGANQTLKDTCPDPAQHPLPGHVTFTIGDWSASVQNRKGHRALS